MALFEHKVEEVLSGSYEEDRIYVNHWTVMDSKLLPMARRPLGKSYELLVEPLAAHPQLESELQFDTIDWDYGAAVYYDVSEQ